MSSMYTDVQNLGRNQGNLTFTTFTMVCILAWITSEKETNINGVSPYTSCCAKLPTVILPSDQGHSTGWGLRPKKKVLDCNVCPRLEAIAFARHHHCNSTKFDIAEVIMYYPRLSPVLRRKPKMIALFLERKARWGLGMMLQRWCSLVTSMKLSGGVSPLGPRLYGGSEFSSWHPPQGRQLSQYT